MEAAAARSSSSIQQISDRYANFEAGKDARTFFDSAYTRLLSVR